ncbi:hypothetical protein BH11MYX1_BH11MYX1_15190 [soil metagenome]
MQPAPPRYTVQVLLPYRQVLDPHVVHQQLELWRADVELLGPSAISDFGFAIPTGDLPLLVQVVAARPDTYASELAEALAWSPTWTDRHSAVAACTHSIVISMVAHRALDHAAMLLAFLSVLDTVLSTLHDLRPIVLHWLPSQRVLAFATYRMLRMEQGPCGPAINVRVAAISDHDVIADTMGLTELGLPDLQTVAHDRDPAELASQILKLARSMFVGDALECTWIEEASIALPSRDAITVQLD